MKTLIVATRGSPLALWQAGEVAARLRERHPGLFVEVLKVKTEGDRFQSPAISSLSSTGVFTREVDQVVMDGRAHAAVHSLKDQPTTLGGGLVLGMVLSRGPVEDVLVARDGARLPDLPSGACVASGSLRRRAQMLRLRPDLRPSDIRGNVETRLRKLDAGEADALILARAGLERLWFSTRITQVFTLEEMMPAVSQGIVGVTCRESDEETQAVLKASDDRATHVVARAERAFLLRLGGGCNVPAGAHAEVRDGVLMLSARVLSWDGRTVLEDRCSGPAADAERIGEHVASILDARGAGSMIREMRR
jgi:hydroxymethylbilane synthase